MVPPMSEIINDAKARHWLKQAEPPQQLPYFQGSLACGTDSAGRPLPEAERQALMRIASWLWRAAQRGVVDLVQRRQGPMNWTYIAIARSSPVGSRRRNNSPHTEMHDAEA